jgi:hypothetical protein
VSINLGDPFMPEKYILYGFDQRTTDMVLLIRFVDVNHTWTAQAINCDFSVRPIYGQINFNVYRLSKTLAVSFQLAVQIFVILSLSSDARNVSFVGI